MDPRRDALVMYRGRCLTLERQNARLLSSDPIRAAEDEIARLEARCFDLTARWSEAESECYELRKLLLSKAG